MRLTEHIFPTAKAMHEALVDHANQALETSVLRFIAAGGNGGLPTHDLCHSQERAKLAELFAEDARERLAQTAQAIELEWSLDTENAYRAGIEFVLKVLERKTRSSTNGLAENVIAQINDAITSGVAEGIRASITKEMISELAEKVRGR